MTLDANSLPKQPAPDPDPNATGRPRAFEIGAPASAADAAARLPRPEPPPRSQVTPLPTYTPPPPYSRAAAATAGAAPRLATPLGGATPLAATPLGATPRPVPPRRPGAGPVYRGLPLPVRIVTWLVFLTMVGFVVGATAPTGLTRLGAVAALQPGLLAWYAVRTLGFLAYFVIAASVLYGLLLSTKILDAIAHRPVSFALHKDLSIVGLVLAALHAIILIGDQSYVFTVRSIVVPFASPYSPVTVGIGQLTFYASAVVTLSFYVRRNIGQRAWRLIHYITFLSFAGASYHGIASGSDSGSAWAFWAYVVPVTAAIFLITYRMVISVAGRAHGTGRAENAAALLGPLDRPGTGGILRRPT